MASHKYDNFDDAFAQLVTSHPIIKNYIDAAVIKASEAYDEWGCADCKPQALKLCQAIWGICTSFDALTEHHLDTWDQSYFYESIYWANKDTEAAEVTWQVICEAWIKNDFEGRALTIAIIDRMRQILWNEPFYILWAARPEQQEF